MITYKYTAKNSQGNTVRGVVDAQSESEVVGELRKKNLIIMDLAKTTGRGASKGPKWKKDSKPGRPKKDELVCCRMITQRGGRRVYIAARPASRFSMTYQCSRAPKNDRTRTRSFRPWANASFSFRNSPMTP